MSQSTNLLKHGLLWAGLLILSATACKKDTGPLSPPQLQFVTEATSLAMQLPDTLALTVKANDPAGLRYLSLSLVDAGFNRVGPVHEVTLQGETVTMQELRLAVTSDLLRSGDYYVVFTASNGESEARKFLPVSLTETPLAFKAMIVISQEGNVCQATLVRPDFSIQTHVLAGNYAGGAALAAGGSFVGFPASQASLRVLDLPAMDQVRTVPVSPSQTAVASVHSADGDMVYAALESGLILGFSRNLQQVFQYQSPSTATPVFVHRLPDHLLLVEQQRSNPEQYHLKMIHPVNKGVIISRSVDFEPVHVVEESENSLIFFGNRGQRGVIIRYYFSSNLLVTVRELPETEKIERVMKDGYLNSSRFNLLATDQAYTYALEGNLLTTHMNKETATVSDARLNWLVHYDGHISPSVIRIEPVNGVPLTLPANGKLLDVKFLFNR